MITDDTLAHHIADRTDLVLDRQAADPRIASHDDLARAILAALTHVRFQERLQRVPPVPANWE